MPDYENLLFGSESLTREEEALRFELVEWCKAKLRKGHRPVPLWMAMKIVAGWMEDPGTYGLSEPPPTRPAKRPFGQKRNNVAKLEQ